MAIHLGICYRKDCRKEEDSESSSSTGSNSEGKGMHYERVSRTVGIKHKHAQGWKEVFRKEELLRESLIKANNSVEKLTVTHVGLSLSFSLMNSHTCCEVCNKQGEEILRCSRCLDAFYCSQACQLQAWPEHKKPCKLISLKRSEIKSLESTTREAAHNSSDAPFSLFQTSSNSVTSTDTLEEITTKAELGDVEAQIKLAKIYRNGELGVSIDKGTSFKWLLRAAEAGHNDAQIQVAMAYNSGDGVERNREEYKKWLQRSSEGGSVVGFALRMTADLNDQSRRGVHDLNSAIRSANFMRQEEQEEERG